MKIHIALLLATSLIGCNASNLETTDQERILFAQISNAPERTLLRTTSNEIWLLKHCTKSSCNVVKAPFKTPSLIVPAGLDSLNIIEIASPSDTQFPQLAAKFLQQD